VRLSGFVSEEALAERYAAADAAVALSEYEGFGLPALEAMGRGVPLVAADRPSLNEVVGDGALLVDPRSPAEIAAALTALLDDPARAAALAARGRAVASRYSWAETARRTRDVLLAAARA
jgi:glycosyltransferase involved in cell wall biosynthesis